MDPVILHHGVSESVATGLVGLTAIVSFAAGVVFDRLYRNRSSRRVDRAVDPAE